MQFVSTFSRKVTREKVPSGKSAGRDEDEDEPEGDEGEVGDAEVSGDDGCESLEEDEVLFGVSQSRCQQSRNARNLPIG